MHKIIIKPRNLFGSKVDRQTDKTLYKLDAHISYKSSQKISAVYFIRIQKNHINQHRKALRTYLLLTYGQSR